MLFLLSALVACTPGRIETASGGPDELRSAWYQIVEGPDSDELRVFLLNSELSCDITPSLADPALRDEALIELYVALTREDARVVALELRRVPGHDGWQGYYPIFDSDELEHRLDGANPFAGRALYVGVNEAEVSADDGLTREYTPTDVEYGWADEPSEVHITEDGGTLRGTFALNGLNVSGRFKASPCADLGFTLDQAESLFFQLLNGSPE